jgi:oxygen-independent coproporphyrinogen-3 oxidase
VEARARAEAGPGLYVHVPFCAVRCHYCDFSSGPLSGRAVEGWLQALEHELERRAPLARGVAFRSAFIGGGTPSALSARHFLRAWQALRARFALAPGAEVTLEANPESVGEGVLATWREAGVNRLSLGMQSAHPDELLRLGRIHDAARVGEALAHARRAGFANLSLDLIYGFPGHTLARWRETLARALELRPEHLSAYNYIPEPGTPMGDAVRRGEQELPTAEEQAAMYRALRLAAAKAGCVHYEISNFARPGRASRHNLGYWLRRDYLGFGPAAHSLWRGRRWGNLHAPVRYARRAGGGGSPLAESERGPSARAAEEALFLGLRLVGGLRLDDYDEAMRATLVARFGAALEAATARGWLRAFAGGWRIGTRHLFVSDEVLAWLLAQADRAREAGAAAPVRGPAHPRADGEGSLGVADAGGRPAVGLAALTPARGRG